MAHQRFERFCRPFAGTDFQVPDGIAQQLFRQQNDVFFAFAQRRQTDIERVEAIEQITAEMASLDGRGQGEVAGGDDAHIGDTQRTLADRTELAVLQKTQQRRLRMRRQRIDFVQKQCPAAGVFDQPRFVALGVGKCAAAVSEQGRFDQILRQRTAVHRHERTQTARAGVMDLACGQFLAGPGISFDQHGHIAGGIASQQAARLLESLGLADHLRQPLSGR